jgi:acetyl esterase
MTNELNRTIPEALREWIEKLREAQRLARAAGYRPTPTNVREALDGLTRRFVTKIPPVPLVRDDLIPGPDYAVPVRIYHPDPERALPVALFAHGGGHMGGGVSVYDGIARKLALAAARVLVSVDYRLTPECPYPAGLKDVLACAKQVFRTLQLNGLAHEPRLAIIGDSAGGALCATLSHLAQFDSSLTIERQVLIYPGLDYTLSQPSTRDLAEGYLLERDRILWMFDAYLQNAENRRQVSPLFMDLTPSYPKTLILSAEFDPLRDEGIAYHCRLRDHGVRSTQQTVPGVIHAFLNLEDVIPDTCEQVYTTIGSFLRAEK